MITLTKIGDNEVIIEDGIRRVIEYLDQWNVVDYPKDWHKNKGKGNVCLTGFVVGKDPANSDLTTRAPRCHRLRCSLVELVRLSGRFFGRTTNGSMYELWHCSPESAEHLESLILTDQVAREYGGTPAN